MGLCTGVSSALRNTCKVSVYTATQPHDFMVFELENPLLVRLKEKNNGFDDKTFDCASEKASCFRYVNYDVKISRTVPSKTHCIGETLSVSELCWFVTGSDHCLQQTVKLGNNRSQQLPHQFQLFLKRQSGTGTLAMQRDSNNNLPVSLYHLSQCNQKQ